MFAGKLQQGGAKLVAGCWEIGLMAEGGVRESTVGLTCQTLRCKFTDYSKRSRKIYGGIFTSECKINTKNIHTFPRISATIRQIPQILQLHLSTRSCV